MAVAAALAALPATPARSAEPADTDTYLGQRAYADPFIWDGWRFGGGYRGPEHYGKSWYYLRLRGPRYSEIDFDEIRRHDGPYPQVRLYVMEE